MSIVADVVVGDCFISSLRKGARPTQREIGEPQRESFTTWVGKETPFGTNRRARKRRGLPSPPTSTEPRGKRRGDLRDRRTLNERFWSRLDLSGGSGNSTVRARPRLNLPGRTVTTRVLQTDNLAVHQLLRSLDCPVSVLEYFSREPATLSNGIPERHLQT